jgi:hypothetical protein
MRGHRREIPSRMYTPEQWAERERIGGRYRAAFGVVLMVAAFPVFASGEGSGWGLPAGVGLMLGGFFVASRRPR